MKRLNTLVVLGFTLLLFSLSAWSQDITVDGLTYSLQDGEATVTGRASDSDSTHIIIPDDITDDFGVVFDVTTIGDEAFRLSRLTSVTIGNNVTTIADRAFYQNPLTSVTIPDSVTTIGNSSFIFNDLDSVTIPDSVTTIGTNAFAYNSLTSVTIGNSVTTIGDFAFVDNNLTSVTIGNSVTTIGGGAFVDNNLTSVTIPDSVSRIGTGAFFQNRLTSMTIPASVTTIEFGAFADNFVEDESGVKMLTLESVIFNGEYVPWEADPDGQTLPDGRPLVGTGISPDAFSFFFEDFMIDFSDALSSITACPSPSWDGIEFIGAEGLPIAVVQTSEACPFVDPVVLIDELSAFVADLNAKNGILNALDAKLGAVQGALSDLNENDDVAALNAMYAFCYNAQAQSGKQLETADADALIAKADAIIAAIDPDAALCSE